MEVCPKCKKTNKNNALECQNCGLIYEKYKTIEKRKKEEKDQIELKKKLQQQQKEERIARHKSERTKTIDGVKEGTRRILSLSRKHYISISILFILISVSGFLYYKNRQEAEYVTTLNLANSLMTLSTIKCVEMCDKYSSTWRDSIDNQFDYDFNDNLSQQRLSFIRDGSIKEIKSSKELIATVLRKLNKPIDAYSEAHKKIVALYGVYSQLYSQAESPSGSLLSYNNKVNELQNEYIQITNEIKILLPSEE